MSTDWRNVLDHLDIEAFYQSEGVSLKHGKSQCVFHEDRHASFSVFGKGRFRCHACGEHGSAFDFWMRRHNVSSFPEAVEAVAAFAPGATLDARTATPAADKRVVATYDYTDEIGNILYQTVRFEPKDFKQRRSTGFGTWEWGLGETRRVLFHLPSVITAVAENKTVFVVEGEKDVITAEGLGLVATTSPMGAGKWRPEYTDVLAGAMVNLIPDNDEPGRKHMEQIATALNSAGCEVKIIELPGLPPKGDLSDWVKLGGTATDLAFLASKTRPWEEQHDGPVIVHLSDVTPREVEWLWYQHFPLGNLSLLAGDGGLGKSTLSLDFASRVSRGVPWPDGGTGVKGNVLLLSAEDALDDTIVPRLMRMGANLDNIKALTAIRVGTGEHEFSLDKDMPHLHRAVEDYQPRLVVIDPLNAYLGNVDSHTDAEVRQVLAPLYRLARVAQAAVICVMHLNKNTATKSDYRIGGSVAYYNSSRSATFVIGDPDEDDRRIFYTKKMNYAALPPLRAFRMNGSILWEPDAVTGIDPDEIMARTSNAKDRSLLEAIAFLEEELPEGVAVPSLQVLKDAKANGIAERTLERAKRKMPNIRSEKAGEQWFMTRKTANHLGQKLADIGGLEEKMSEHMEDDPTPPTPPHSAPEGWRSSSNTANGGLGGDGGVDEEDDEPHWNR